MLRRISDRKLESFKIFPYIAWGLIIIFVFFVYKLTTSLNATAEELDAQSSSLENKVNANNKDLKNLNFEQ